MNEAMGAPGTAPASRQVIAFNEPRWCSALRFVASGDLHNWMHIGSMNFAVVAQPSRLRVLAASLRQFGKRVPGRCPNPQAGRLRYGRSWR